MPLKITERDTADARESARPPANELIKRLKLACDHADEIRMLLEFLDPEASARKLEMARENA